MPSVVLDEVVDASGLRRLAATLRDDCEGMAEFGGFYRDAPARLGPLLGPDRRAWLIVADGGDAGFLDADLVDGEVGLSWFVRERARGRGVGRAAVGRLFGLAPWPEADGYAVAVAPGNTASRALAIATGFAADGLDERDAEHWRRPLPRPRASADDPRRFLDGGGRVREWPVTAKDRLALLTWLRDQVLADGEVVDERTINDRLRAVVDDPAVARRYLVDHELVERTRSGSEYAAVTEVSPGSP